MKTVLHLLLAALLLCGCEKKISGPMPQRGYLWQRDWTPAVEQAFAQAQSRLDGVTVLGGEILWDGATPHFVKSSVRWEAVAQSDKPTGLALRVAPFTGSFDDANTGSVIDVARRLQAEAAGHHVLISEFQLDYDCPQKKLAGYGAFLHSLGEAIRPTRFTITALPSWLDEPEFVRLLREVDGYVVQVHSVPAIGRNKNAVLCDPQLARNWVAKAARLGRAFSVALPTYRCLGGYGADGKLVGVAMDSVQPAWPRGTRVLEFGANADELALLVAEWKHARPATLRDLIWYRVPIETDARNWRWPTLAAVIDGRASAHKLEAASEGENPIDLVLVNNGEADEQFAGEVTAEWREAALVSSDAVSGWILRVENNRALFAVAPEQALRLSPGERRAIGWLRYDQHAQLQLAINPTTR
ncbi:MAG: DUF3142 domain-containing protein [Chthoniobacterales bacterium]